MGKTNWLAIIVASAVGMGIGFLWYGLFFQDTWMAGNFITMADENTLIKHGETIPTSATPMIINTIAIVVLALLTNWLQNYTDQTSASEGGLLGFIVGIFAAINILLTNLFAANSISLTAIDASYVLVLFTMMGLIIGAWRKN